MRKRRGCFITFEGAEGSGKSTQIKRAASCLRKKGCGVVTLREPGGTQVSEAIRKILLDKGHKKLSAPAELLLYLAARAQIVREKILPALKKGQVVICDRFEDSTLAYQGYGRGIPVETIRKIWRLVWGGGVPLQPDLTFLLDLDPAQGMRRGGRHDRMERQSLAFHRRVRQGFLALARKDKKRFVVLDSHAPIDAVARKIQYHLERLLKIKRGQTLFAKKRLTPFKRTPFKGASRVL